MAKRARYLLINRQAADIYRDLLSLADIDAILANTNVRRDHLRLARDGHVLPPPSVATAVPTLESVYREYPIRRRCWTTPLILPTSAVP